MDAICLTGGVCPGKNLDIFLQSDCCFGHKKKKTALNTKGIVKGSVPSKFAEHI